ncbi:hypothetical protein EBS43_09385, partial [bacterium]|nr:hypothetical protein [bacterium]
RAAPSRRPGATDRACATRSGGRARAASTRRGGRGAAAVRVRSLRVRGRRAGPAEDGRRRRRLLRARSKRANPGVAELFTQHLAQKTYQALCSIEQRTELKEAWVIRNYLGKDKRAGSKANRYCSVRSGGDFAHTEFKLLERHENFIRVEAKPLTGRTHQIRVHLSEAGFPILGDTHYGGTKIVASYNISRVMLHAATLTFPHPIHKNKMTIQSSLPHDFTQCLNHLCKSVVD